MEPPPVPDSPPSAPPPGPTLVDWVAALAVCAAAFAFFWAYHDWWRGKPYSVPTANEALALAALVGLSLSLSAAPWRSLRGRGGEPSRRAFPLLTASGLCAVLHTVFTFGLLPDKYDSAWQADHRAVLGLGTAALLLLLALFVAGLPALRRRLNARLAPWLQPAALLVLGLALTHFMLLGKPAKWAAWFRDPDRPTAPPGTLPGFLIGLLPFVLAGLAALRRRRPAPPNRTD